MYYYLPLLLIPSLLVILFSKFFWKHKITLKEMGLQLAGAVVGTLFGLMIVGLSAISFSGDFSIFNGQVTGKERVEVSCQHEYKCGEKCRTVQETDEKGKPVSREYCEPVYCDEHKYDVDWDVYTTLGTWTIDRVDRRGLTMPPRWEEVFKGEPVAESRYNLNYLLLDKHRFETTEDIRAKYKDKLMAYPTPFDYYRYKRIVQDNKQDYDGIKIWLDNQLRKDGPAKELNVILVITQNEADYYYALIEAWKGVRKNDVVLFYGVDDEDKIQWSRAMSFADGQSNQVMLKNLESMTYNQTLAAELVQAQYKFIVDNFVRLPNKTFKYLNEHWTPPFGVVVFMALLNLLFAAGVAWFVIKEDVFDY